MFSNGQTIQRFLSGSVRMSLIAIVCLLGASALANDRTLPMSTPAASAGPGSSLAYLLAWGKHALEQGRFTEAEARFREVLEIDWNHPRAFDLMREARAGREKALKTWGQAAWAAAAAGNHADAIAYFNRILAEDPGNPEIVSATERMRRKQAVTEHIQAGLTKFIVEDYPGAQLDFELALAVDPEDTLAALYRDRAEKSIGHSSSLADIRSDTQAWSRYLEALKKFRAGDLSGAENLWRSLLERYPGNDAVQSNLEQVARRQKQEFSASGVAP